MGKVYPISNKLKANQSEPDWLIYGVPLTLTIGFLMIPIILWVGMSTGKTNNIDETTSREIVQIIPDKDILREDWERRYFGDLKGLRDVTSLMPLQAYIIYHFNGGPRDGEEYAQKIGLFEWATMDQMREFVYEIPNYQLVKVEQCDHRHVTAYFNYKN